MKIKVEKEKIVRAVRKLEGIEIVLDDSADAKEAIGLVQDRNDLFSSSDYHKPADIIVTEIKEYENSAVDYRILFVLEFVFDEEVDMSEKVAFIKEFQSFLKAQ